VGNLQTLTMVMSCAPVPPHARITASMVQRSSYAAITLMARDPALDATHPRGCTAGMLAEVAVWGRHVQGWEVQQIVAGSNYMYQGGTGILAFYDMEEGQGVETANAGQELGVQPAQLRNGAGWVFSGPANAGYIDRAVLRPPPPSPPPSPPSPPPSPSPPSPPTTPSPPPAPPPSPNPPPPPGVHWSVQFDGQAEYVTLPGMDGMMGVSMWLKRSMVQVRTRFKSPSDAPLA